MNSRTDPQIERLIDRLGVRLRLSRASDGAQWGLLLGLAFGALIAVAMLLVGSAVDLLAVLVVPGVCIVAGSAAGYALPVDRLRLARALDQASGSQDRFASALQLLESRADARARLVVVDALRHVSATSVARAIPVRAKRVLRWAPIPALVIIASLFIDPGAAVQAQPEPPEVSSEEWATLADRFKRDMEALDDPEGQDDQDLQEQLDQLAKLLEEQPEKKVALARIARLKADLERRQKENGTKDLSTEKAAKAIKSSKRLEEFAKKLREGKPEEAAKSLEELAQRLREQIDRMTAEEFEEISEDMAAMAREMAADDQLAQQCENASAAASSLNSDKLAEAMERLAEQLRNDAERLRRGNRMGRAGDMLDRLRKALGQAGKGRGQGRGQGGFGEGEEKSEGSGWGSAPDWTCGSLGKQDEDRRVEGADPAESQGDNTMVRTVSRDERAESVQEMRERYIDLIKKAEADLALEGVPLSEREFLRRYFDAIRPEAERESTNEGTP